LFLIHISRLAIFQRARELGEDVSSSCHVGHDGAYPTTPGLCTDHRFSLIPRPECQAAGGRHRQAGGLAAGGRAAGATIDVVYATIDVVYVVDCGRAKMKMFDPARNFATLRPEWISRANARQRMGRAGRLLGFCIFVFVYLCIFVFSG
jgi:hypothetical protein